MTSRPPLFVPGTPVQQGSKSQDRHGRMHEAAGPRLKAWRTAIGWAVHAAGWHRHPISAGPVALRLVFTFPRLTSDPGRDFKVSAPDLDKLVRAVGDALTQSGAYRDDAQVAELTATKHHGETPGVLIDLYSLIPHTTTPESAAS